MADRFLCIICDLQEEKCICEKFCCLCQGHHDVRLVGDGQYYCTDCREACEYAAQKPLTQ